MSIAEAISLALGSLRTNKIRSILTLLGVIIGIAAIITILTLGAALKKQTMQELESVGVNNVSAKVVKRDDTGDEDPWGMPSSQITDTTALMRPETIEKIRASAGDQISEIGISQGTVSGEAVPTVPTPSQSAIGPNVKNKKVFLEFVNGDSQTMGNLMIVAGRGITDDDIASERQVATVPQTFVDQKFGGDPHQAVGSMITFTPAKHPEIEFVITGVYKPAKPSVLFGEDPTQTLYAPYPLAARVSDDANAGEAFQSLNIRAQNGVDKKAFIERLQSDFDALYANNKEYKVKVSDNSNGVDSLNKLLSTISLALSAIGGLSLLVGGVGVMNIMLITVTERTREIGVRKALGARGRDIRLQFVIEAMIVCLLGGLIGVLLGAVFGMIGANLLGTFVLPPLSGIVIAFVFSLAIGVFFGYYPAGKAAKLDPIEALRYE